MKSTAVQAAAAVSIAALLLLNGCSLIPGIPDLGGGNSSDDSESDSNGDDVDDNPFLDHGVPDGFPDDVPLPDLDISFSVTTTEDAWSIIYKSDDLEGDYADVVSMYEDDGWEVAMNNASADGSLGLFIKDPYQVQVMGIPDDNTDFDGDGISFTVVRS